MTSVRQPFCFVPMSAGEATFANAGMAKPEAATRAALPPARNTARRSRYAIRRGLELVPGYTPRVAENLPAEYRNLLPKQRFSLGSTVRRKIRASLCKL